MTQQQWENNKALYAEQILSNVHTKKDAQMLDNVRVFNEKEAIVFNAGIFNTMTEEAIPHNSIKWFDDNAYFISFAKMGDG